MRLILTGGSRGIGKDLCKSLRAQDHTVLVTTDGTPENDADFLLDLTDPAQGIALLRTWSAYSPFDGMIITQYLKPPEMTEDYLDYFSLTRQFGPNVAFYFNLIWYAERLGMLAKPFRCLFLLDGFRGNLGIEHLPYKLAISCIPNLMAELDNSMGDSEDRYFNCLEVRDEDTSTICEQAEYLTLSHIGSNAVY